MAGTLDTLFKQVAKQVVADLGSAMDASITYTRSYVIKVPIEFVDSSEQAGFQENKARLYITPDLIGSSQPLLQDEITLTFSGSTRIAKIVDVRTLKGGQEYLFRVDVVF